jgi:hypothetical protein
VASGGTGGGLDLWLVTVPNIYHKSRVVDFGALARVQGEALGLGAGRRKVDDMYRSAAHVTR